MNNSNNREDKDMQTEEQKKIKVRKFEKNNSKDLFLINSRLKAKNNKYELENEKDFIPNKNIISLDGRISLGIQNTMDENPIQKPKKYNKQLNMNKFLKFKSNIIRNNSNKAMNIISDSNKNKVHLVDPLLYDKFNERYFINSNKRFKTLEI